MNHSLTNGFMEENSDEQHFLAQIERLLKSGEFRKDRTGVGTFSTFGTQLRYNLRNGVFPLLTTRKIFWRAVVEELLWFIRGSTDADELSAKNVHIWDANSCREFLDKRGLTDYEAGDLGPIYGFQWRHFGAAYKTRNDDYQNQGIDQLKYCIDLIKNDPNNRRIIMTSWNPVDIPKMALPPCHCMVQFYVSNGEELSCQVYQRAADMGLGAPYNIASYSLLVYMICHVTGLRPGDFVHTIGDTHVYANHVEGLKEQLKRTPRPFPKLVIKRKIDSIDDFRFQDFELIDYEPYPKIYLPMAV